MIRKLTDTIILILLVEFLLAYVTLFYYGLNFFGYTSDLEEATFSLEVVLMFLMPIVISLFVFKGEIIKKIGDRKFWIIMFVVLASGFVGFLYFENVVLFLFA